MVQVEWSFSYQDPENWRKEDSVSKLGSPPLTFLKNCKDSILIKTSKLQDSETVATPRNHECKVTAEYRQVK